MIKSVWNKLDTVMKLGVACVVLYLSLYIVVGIAECIGKAIALALM